MATREGRTAILEINPDVQKRFLQALTLNATIADAAAYAGVGERTVYEWLAIGRGDKKRKGDNSAYKHFSQETTRAMSLAKLSLIKAVTDAKDDDWRAAAWILERRHPKEWANTQRIELAAQSQVKELLTSLEAEMAPEDYVKLLEAIERVDPSKLEADQGV